MRPLAVLVALALALPLSAAAPFVPDGIFGFGYATTFQTFGAGGAFEGGAYERNDICGDCWILITIFDGFVLDVDDTPRQLTPGQYELREFRGVFSHTYNAPFDYAFQLQGVGKMESR